MTKIDRHVTGATADARPMKGFRHREDGSMTLLGIFILMSSLLVVGIGVDIMRYERDRAHLQNTLDRAVLAAADLDQPLSPEAVVQDYFAKAGLSDSLTNVSVTETLGSRTVTASAEMQVGTFFMQMTGVDYLSISNVSTAQEAIDSVEISLVLDVSGSMGNYGRLTNLKSAAKEFVDSMFDNSEAGTVTISIVPYATQVTAPQQLFDQLNVKFRPIEAVIDTMTEEQITAIADHETAAAAHARAHNLSLCINWPGDEFTNTSISSETEYERTLHFDPWDNFDGRDNDPVDLVRNPVCEADSRREMILLSDNRGALKNYIDGFYADGNTSLDVGMKWGSILLDPSFQPIAAQLADPAIGLVSPAYADRPVAHNDAETIKVIVLMTDGQNTDQYFMNENFRLGDSNIWWNEQEEIYSVYLGQDEDDDNNNGRTDDGLYYWPWNDTFQDHAYGEGVFEETETTWECRSWRRNGSCRNYRQVTTTVVYDEPGEAVLLSYPELWAWTSMQRIVEALYEPFMNDNDAWNDWYWDVFDWVGHSTKNARTQAICNASKENGTIVFTIGFEAPTSVMPLLRDCASSPAHAFDVDGLEISDAFAAIASSIRQLRLTQ